MEFRKNIISLQLYCILLVKCCVIPYTLSMLAATERSICLMEGMKKYEDLHSTIIQVRNELEIERAKLENYVEECMKSNRHLADDPKVLQQNEVVDRLVVQEHKLREMLENEKCEDPYDLVKSNNWTFAKFQEICKKVTKSLSGGAVDQWGLTTVDWHANNFEKPMIFANGGTMIAKNNEGKYQFSLLSKQK